MKHFFSIVFLLVAIVACSQLEAPIMLPEEAAPVSSYNITLSEINRIDFSRLIAPQTKASTSLSKEITPIVEDADTLLYVINYGDNDGWVLASADRRTSAVMAMGETGDFDYQTALTNDGLAAWLNTVKDGIKFLKEHPDYVPDSSLVQSCPTPDIKTKDGGGEHEGEWLQLVYTMIAPQVRYYVDHLMDTQWGQGSPWNTCVPFDGNGNRCKTGTGPAALAQLAYYWRKPSTAYAYGTCTTNYYETSDLQLYNASASVWNTMSLDGVSGTSAGNQAVAALMAEIGASTQSMYLPTKTVSSMSYCGSYLTSKGYSITLSSFDNDMVLSSILADRPVLLCVSSGTDYEYAVIDGIEVYADCTIYFYQWMPIGTYPPVEPEYPDMEHLENYEISVNWGDNVNYYHRVNWGFDGLYDNGWYTTPYWPNQVSPYLIYSQIH